MFTQKGKFMTTWLDPRKSLINIIQKKDKIREYDRKEDLATKKRWSRD